MTEINGKCARIRVKDPFTFQIELDTSGFSPYICNVNYYYLNSRVSLNK